MSKEIDDIVDKTVVEMDVDEALEVGGPCGISQTVLQFLFMATCVSVSFHAVESYFTGNDPSWRCVTNINSTTNNISAANGSRISLSPFCKKNINATITSDDTHFYQRCYLNREEWTYSTDKTYSFVTEFDLVCDKSAIAAFAGGSIFLGGLLGCMITGIISDMYGRKSVMIASQALVIASSVACSYSANIWQLTVARVVLGGAQMTCFSIGYTAMLEFVAPSYRTLCSMMYQMMFCLSQLFIDLIAYFHREWRTLQFYSSFACALSLIIFFIVPNSPRWLTSKGNYSEAKKVLEDIAKYNRNPLPTFKLKSESCKPEKNNYTYVHLFKTWKVFVVTSVLSFIWLTCALLYFAIALESSNLGGNMYQAFALTGIADLPSYFAALFACNIIGRKKTVLGCLLFAGIFIGSCSFIPQGYKYKYLFNITLVMLAKFFTTSAFNTMFLWTFEIYPTVLRSQGSSYCIAWERFGAFCAPFLISVLQRVNYILPYIIMSVSSITCVLIGLVLPETRDCPTRETYEDMFNDSSVTKKINELTETGYENNGMDKSEAVNDSNV